MRYSLDYAGLAQLCARSPIMRKIMRAHNRIIQPSLISTNFEVNMTIHCRVIALLSADTSRDLLILSSWRTCRVTWPTLPPSLKTLRLSVLELWVITFPVGYHCKCVRDHCACAKSRDPWVGGQNDYIFRIPDSNLPIHYRTFIALRLRLRVVYSQVVQC